MSYSSAKKTQYPTDDCYSYGNINPFCRTESKNYYTNSYNYMKTGHLDNCDMDFMSISNVEHNNNNTTNYNRDISNFNNSFSHFDDRKGAYERKSLLDTIQTKDNEIKTLNHNIEKTIEHCETIIKETEENYLNLKLQVIFNLNKII